MRAWIRASAVLLVALALAMVIPTKRLLGEERRMDSQMLAEVSQHLAMEDRFKNLRVEVEGDTVRLRGTVAVLEDRRQAVQKAHSVNDVKLVVSHIKIETERIGDGMLLKRLQERLAEDHNSHIRLKVKKGVVTIRGIVRHDTHREQVLSSVASMPGVIGMEDRLQVVVN